MNVKGAAINRPFFELTTRKMSLKSKITRLAKKGAKTSKKVTKKISTGVKVLAEKAKDLGQFVLLRPYEGLMRSALRAKGITPKTSLDQLATQFYNEVVRKDTYNDQFDGPNNDVIMAIGLDEAFGPNTDSLDPATITAIVAGIVTWIKKKREKEASGQPLTKTEKVIVNAAKEAEVKTEALIDEETSRTVGDVVRQYWWIAALVLAAFMFAAYKRNK